MLSDPSQPIPSSSPRDAIAPIFSLYSALSSTLPLDAELGLGGKLLYAGGIEDGGRTLLYAANIAGAASLAASADPVVQRAAIRDGVVDFFVTSLEEALRILKNEVRKRHAVSVGVTVGPEALAAAMLDRGVLPDLLPPLGWGLGGTVAFLADGARQIVPSAPETAEFVTWGVEGQFARWLPRLDGCVQMVLPAEDLVRKRWVRLAPRYLGRMAQREHGVVLDASELALFRSKVAETLAAFPDEELVRVTIQGAAF